MQRARILENCRIRRHIDPSGNQARMSHRRTTIAQRPQAAQSPKKEGPQINEDIRAPRVLLIDEKGEKQGEMPIDAALDAAKEVGLDLVMVAPDNDPPVVKISDYGKQRFAEQKKKAEARKKQKTVEVKEIKLRPRTDKHDLDIKIRQIKEFLADGNKTKVTLTYRGREMANQEMGRTMMTSVIQQCMEAGTVEFAPRMEGRSLIMILAPK